MAGRVMGRRGLPLLAVLAALCGACSSRAADELDWKPEKTWVVVVGVLEWKASDLYQSFPKEGRRDAELAEFFRTQGVPGEQVVFLKDKQATRARIAKTLSELLPKTQENDLLILYYAGHGTRVNGVTYFANYDITAETAASGWSVPSIFDAIEKDFKGSRVLLAADCCFSGALGVEAGKRKNKIAYAALTSVQPNCTSTGNWTFTECLLKGLRGDPSVDLNGDGQVLLSELAQRTVDDMAFDEGQMAWFSTANGFDAKMKLAAAAKKDDARIGDPIEIKWKDSWRHAHVLAVKDGKSLVHYVGQGNDDDEWVAPDRIRAYKPKEFPKGALVEVEWEKKWWPAKVMDSRYGLHSIHYDGYGPEWDEWVGPQRIRQAKSE